MVDLTRLKIHDGARHGVTLGKGLILLAVVLLVLGFGAGHYINLRLPWEEITHTVKTMVARKSKPVSVSAFTAGGWIEAAAPKYPYYVMSQIQMEIITRINVKEGDMVKPGQVLAEVYSVNKKLAMDLAHAKWHIAEAEYERLKNGYRAEEIQGAKASLQDVQEQLVLAEQNFSRSEKLGKDVVTQTQIDEHRSAVAALKARVEKESANLALLEAGYREEEVQGAHAALVAAEIQHAQAKLSYELCFIKVPSDMPEMRVLKVFAKEGQMLNSEDRMGMILSLYDPKDMQARVDIRQQNIKQVRVGGPVQIRTDADVSQLYHGTVLRIDPEADIAKNTVSVKIKIDDPDMFLFPEMVSQISFLVPEYENDTEEETDDEEACDDPECTECTAKKSGCTDPACSGCESEAKPKAKPKTGCGDPACEDAACCQSEKAVKKTPKKSGCTDPACSGCESEAKPKAKPKTGCGDPACEDAACGEESEDDTIVEDTSIMMIPQTAVQRDENDVAFVWINAQQKAKKCYITISKVVDGKVIVSGGLASGSRVIISDTSMLRDGDNVKEE